MLTSAHNKKRLFTSSDNTNIIRIGKYHCTTHILLYSFGNSCLIMFKMSTDLLVWQNVEPTLATFYAIV